MDEPCCARDACPEFPRVTGMVVVVHGLWMPGIETGLLRRRLHAAGFATTLYTYPTVSASLSANIERFADFLAGLSDDVIHVLGFSLGGVLAVATAQTRDWSRPGRIVGLGAPLNGTRSGEALGRFPGGQYLAGRSIAELNARGGLRSWTGPRALGCVAGSAGFGMGRLVTAFGGPNDGTVAVAETRLAGLTDHVVLPVTHTTMLFDAAVARQAIAFLRTGAFEH